MCHLNTYGCRILFCTISEFVVLFSSFKYMLAQKNEALPPFILSSFHDSWGKLRRAFLEVTSQKLINNFSPFLEFPSSADGNYEVTIMTKAILHHTGKVVWKPPAIYVSIHKPFKNYYKIILNLSTSCCFSVSVSHLRCCGSNFCYFFIRLSNNQCFRITQKVSVWITLYH